MKLFLSRLMQSLSTFIIPHLFSPSFFRTSVALMVYRDAMVAGVMPTMEVLSQVLGCLHLPYDASLQDKLIENLGVSVDVSRCSNLYSLIDGFGEYDPRAFSIVEVSRS